MSDLRVVTNDDAAQVLAAAGTFLHSAPARHNLVLTILHERCTHPEPGRYWTVVDRGEVIGVALQSPLTFHATMTPMPPAAVVALADCMVDTVPELPGIFGEADATARFAGYWAELRKVPAAPLEGQRLYQLGSLRPPTGVGGRLRRAAPDDELLVLSWLQAFERDTGGQAPLPSTIRRRISDGLVHVWEVDEPVAMAAFTPPVAGVSRVGLVYTPPGHRRRGFAAACTAATTATALEAGARECVLFTQLQNPQSNAIYRRLGYNAIAEHLRYRFGE